MPKFKDKSLQKMYEACRAAGRDLSSEFYLGGKPRKGGAAHREAYWKGRDGKPNTLWPRGSLAAACYAAGKDDRKHGAGLVSLAGSARTNRDS